MSCGECLGDLVWLNQIAKPISINSNVAGIKRKAETIANAGGNETPSISASKKPQKGWRCNLCQVSTTCERGLNDHLRGRKHKAKEALLRASKTVSLMTNNSYPFPEESEMSTELAVPTGSLNPNQGERPKGNQEVMEYGNAVVQKMQNTGDLKINGKLLLDKSQQQLKFWCQMCNFGTNSETLMEDHQNGKTHLNLLLKNGGAVIAISTVPEHVQKIEEANSGQRGNGGQFAGSGSRDR
ncbi:hypothetical protein L1049_013120 [Liquidambar formosana]|uniref:C2H2-type domain-containing protein n=1 Tax=Liquidambar formosana TaxID=63359 RepID=A0AAP0RJS7_LIQFO